MIKEKFYCKFQEFCLFLKGKVPGTSDVIINISNVKIRIFKSKEEWTQLGQVKKGKRLKKNVLKRIVNLQNDGHVFTYNTLFVFQKGKSLVPQT